MEKSEIWPAELTPYHPKRLNRRCVGDHVPNIYPFAKLHYDPIKLITRHRSVAKSVGCFQRRLFVCVFVCQHSNFQTSKHRMMKLGVGALYKNLGRVRIWVIGPGCAPPKCDVKLRRWENQHRLLSSWRLILRMCGGYNHVTKKAISSENVTR